MDDYDDHDPNPPSACLVSHLTYSSLTVTIMIKIMMLRIIIMDDYDPKDRHNG